MFGRRDFLKRFTLGAAAVLAAVEIDPERLLWVPGAKTIFLPTEKTLIDPAVAAAEYESLLRTAQDQRVQALLDIERAHGVPGIGGHVVHTAVGNVVSDAQWNVITVNGKEISATEAAKLRLSYFNRSGRQPSIEQVARMASQIVGERMQAGWSFERSMRGMRADNWGDGFDFKGRGPMRIDWDPLSTSPRKRISTDG